MVDKKIIGKRIREERKNHKYTLKKFSLLTGIGEVYLGQIERGIKTPSLSTFIKMINCFSDVSADKILRDYVVPGIPYALTEIDEKIQSLSPQQLCLVNNLIDAVITSTNEIDNK